MRDRDPRWADVSRLLKMEWEAEESNQAELTAVLRAACIMALYNVIEARIRQNLIQVRAAIRWRRPKHATLAPTWRQQALRSIPNHPNRPSANSRIALEELDTFIFDILPRYRAFWPGKIDESIPAAGNVGDKAFHEVLTVFLAEPVSTDWARTSPFDTLRSYRNSLAHGNESFTDVGARVSRRDLIRLVGRTSFWLRRLDNAGKAYIGLNRFAVVFVVQTADFRCDPFRWKRPTKPAPHLMPRLRDDALAP